MVAQAKLGIVIQAISQIEGVGCLVTGCADYDEYRALPQVVRFEERLYGRTGWNSDRGVAYYQTNAMVALTDI